MIIAILIGRENSSGYPGKNVTDVAGKPLVAWPLEAARMVKEIDRIYVSTDSPGIKDIALQYGALIIDRPAHLCTKEALGEHAYQHAHQVIKAELAKHGIVPELYALLMANAPTIAPEQLREGIAALRKNPDYDSAVTVSCYNMWSPLRARKIGPDGLLHPFVPFETFGDPKTLNCDRDSQGDSWFADMGVSLVRPRNLDDLESGLLPQKWMGQKIYPIKNDGGLDIDYGYQMPQAEYWLKARGRTGNA
jgi:Cytidylyltransferase